MSISSRWFGPSRREMARERDEAQALLPFPGGRKGEQSEEGEGSPFLPFSEKKDSPSTLLDWGAGGRTIKGKEKTSFPPDGGVSANFLICYSPGVKKNSGSGKGERPPPLLSRGGRRGGWRRLSLRTPREEKRTLKEKRRGGNRRFFISFQGEEEEDTAFAVGWGGGKKEPGNRNEILVSSFLGERIVGKNEGV